MIPNIVNFCCFGFYFSWTKKVFNTEGALRIILNKRTF
ncbi:hypothetical protein C7382_10386 [Porphyromonas loveana]|uniref:Uncharacterized protein n=1 Tax=Porphyromonas loveana TaxID=1884669 RepID=A0A2U1FMH0_9PORP|nr:hypothetical protein C7382_10386 [Porphyromonas loveana]